MLRIPDVDGRSSRVPAKSAKCASGKTYIDQSDDPTTNARQTRSRYGWPSATIASPVFQERARKGTALVRPRVDEIRHQHDAPRRELQGPPRSCVISHQPILVWRSRGVSLTSRTVTGFSAEADSGMRISIRFPLSRSYEVSRRWCEWDGTRSISGVTMSLGSSRSLAGASTKCGACASTGSWLLLGSGDEVKPTWAGKPSCCDTLTVKG